MHCVCRNMAAMRLGPSLLVLLALVNSARAAIPIVAAENFYGGVVKQIGGDQVSVTSILTNPDQDPHLFTVDTNTARAVSHAAIVIESGIDSHHVGVPGGGPANEAGDFLLGIAHEHFAKSEEVFLPNTERIFANGIAE